MGKMWGALAGLALDYVKDKYIDDKNSQEARDWSMDSSALAFERSYDAYKRRYTDTMADMRGAGLNPILAASSGFNVGTSPQMSKPDSFMSPQPSGDYMNSAKAFEESEKTKEETENVKVEREKLKEEVKRTMAETKEKIQNTNVLNEKEKVEAQKFWNTVQEFHVKTQQIDKMEAEIEELQARSDYEHQQSAMVDNKRKEIDAMRRKLEQEAKGIEAKNLQLIKRNKVYKGVLGDINAGVKETISILKGSNP